jgi:hypothetical protein
MRAAYSMFCAARSRLVRRSDDQADAALDRDRRSVGGLGDVAAHLVDHLRQREPPGERLGQETRLVLGQVGVDRLLHAGRERLAPELRVRAERDPRRGHRRVAREHRAGDGGVARAALEVEQPVCRRRLGRRRGTLLLLGLRLAPRTRRHGGDPTRARRIVPGPDG